MPTSDQHRDLTPAAAESLLARDTLSPPPHPDTENKAIFKDSSAVVARTSDISQGWPQAARDQRPERNHSVSETESSATPSRGSSSLVPDASSRVPEDSPPPHRSAENKAIFLGSSADATRTSDVPPGWSQTAPDQRPAQGQSVSEPEATAETPPAADGSLRHPHRSAENKAIILDSSTNASKTSDVSPGWSQAASDQRRERVQGVSGVEETLERPPAADGSSHVAVASSRHPHRSSENEAVFLGSSADVARTSDVAPWWSHVAPDQRPGEAGRETDSCLPGDGPLTDSSANANGLDGGEVPNAE
jgi:hypothetical protein